MINYNAISYNNKIYLIEMEAGPLSISAAEKRSKEIIENAIKEKYIEIETTDLKMLLSKRSKKLKK